MMWQIIMAADNWLDPHSHTATENKLDKMHSTWMAIDLSLGFHSWLALALTFPPDQTAFIENFLLWVWEMEDGIVWSQLSGK